MKYNSLIQLGLIVVSITIIFTYIQPTFAEIGLVQDELFEYADAVNKASEFNQRLRELSSIANGISGEDMNRLNRLLPTAVDAAQVMRDLEVIVERTNLTLTSLESEPMFVPSLPADYDESDFSLALSYQDFMLDVTGEYDELKALFADLEQNDYLLEVMGMEFASAQSVSPSNSNRPGAQVITADDFTARLVLRVYAQTTAAVTNRSQP